MSDTYKNIQRKSDSISGYLTKNYHFKEHQYNKTKGFLLSS